MIDHSACRNAVKLLVTIPARLSYTGKERLKDAGIDACIAPIVRALNDGGVLTVASCCGHGHRPGRISLADGRELFIAPDYKTATEIDAAFPADINGEAKAMTHNARLIDDLSTRRKAQSGKVHEMADFGVKTLCGVDLPEPWEWTDEPTNCKRCLRLEAKP